MPYTVCTALIQCTVSRYRTSVDERLTLLEAILTKLQPTDVLLLPGGFFFFDKEPSAVYKWIEQHIPPLVKQYSPQTTVALGLDTYIGRKQHELAVACNKNKIKAVARKFHGFGSIVSATGPWALEDGWVRTFSKNGKQYYLAVCYDSFGLRQADVSKDRTVDAVLNTIHCFRRAGKPLGGDVQFARHGLAGAAHHWKRPVFGAVHFLRPQIPASWPSGVKWKRGLASDHHWTYADNTLKPQQIDILKVGRDTAELRYYQF